jgi:hypothetical protein
MPIISFLLFRLLSYHFAWTSRFFELQADSIAPAAAASKTIMQGIKAIHRMKLLLNRSSSPVNHS